MLPSGCFLAIEVKKLQPYISVCIFLS